MTAPNDDVAALRIDVAAMFVFDADGRIRSENEPKPTVGPRVYFGGCAGGNVVCFRHDVKPAQAAEISAVFAAEPPLSEISSRPRHIEEYVRILSEDGEAPAVSFGLTWRLPHDNAYAQQTPIVAGESEEGRALAARFRREGMPRSLFDLGFVDADELWPPWCAALSGNEIAALAFAARLGREGAELGVVTVPAFRGRGFAAAVTAGWARLPALADRALFYSTSIANVSSQRVTARLGLRFFGASCRLS